MSAVASLEFFVHFVISPSWSSTSSPRLQCFQLCSRFHLLLLKFDDIVGRVSTCEREDLLGLVDSD